MSDGDGVFADEIRKKVEERQQLEVQRINTAVANSIGYTEHGLRSGVKRFREGCNRQWNSLWGELRSLEHRDCLTISLCLLQDVSDLLAAYLLYVRSRRRNSGS